MGEMVGVAPVIFGPANNFRRLVAASASRQSTTQHRLGDIGLGGLLGRVHVHAAACVPFFACSSRLSAALAASKFFRVGENRPDFQRAQAPR